MASFGVLKPRPTSQYQRFEADFLPALALALRKFPCWNWKAFSC